MLMHFNDTRMGTEVGVPFYLRKGNSNQKLFEEIISCINADYPQMIEYLQKAENR